MNFFQNIFLVSILCIFANFVYSDNSNFLNIREKGSSSNNFTANATSSTFLSANITQKISQVTRQNVSNLMQVASEGGGIISPTTGGHNGKENTLEHPLPATVIHKANETNSSFFTDAVVVSLDVAPQQDDEKPSVPKKGVSFHDLDSPLKSSFNNATNNFKLNISNPTSKNVIKKVPNNVISNNTSSTNSTVIHKKPLITESDTDFIDMSKSNPKLSKEPSSSEAISIDQMDPVLIDKKSKRSDYIVPIVAVILSVPLVAILTSILYKRGTDWWQHRNYKRMDFLIEGMYHN